MPLLENQKDQTCHTNHTDDTKDNLTKKSNNKVVSWFFVILWMSIIFIMSHDSSSGEHSGLIMELLRSFFSFLGVSNPSEELLEILHTLVRKLAHICEYAILFCLLRRTSMKKGNAFFISAFYAATDEIHQTFIPNRAGLFSDFIIDCCGPLLVLFFDKFSNKEHNTKILK